MPTPVNKERVTAPPLQEFANASAAILSLAPDYPIYCLRPHVITNTARRFIALFPGTVMYAIKCNPHWRVVDALLHAGIRDFDVASLPEIAQVNACYQGAQSHFMHPVKSRRAIREAYTKYGVRGFSIDHPTELEKIVQETSGENVRLFVRVKTPSLSASLYNLSEKFGAEPWLAAELLTQARSLGYRVGLAFHVGSQCLAPEAYGVGLNLVAEVADRANIVPEWIDVGGGFPVEYPGLKVPPLEHYMEEIRQGLSRLGFGDSVRIYSEPGRALVAAGCSLLTQVLLRKDYTLYINDGVHGGLAELLDSKYELRSPACTKRFAGETQQPKIHDFRSDLRFL